MSVTVEKKYRCAFVKTMDDLTKCFEENNNKALLSRVNKITVLIKEIKESDKDGKLMKDELKKLQETILRPNLSP